MRQVKLGEIPLGGNFRFSPEGRLYEVLAHEGEDVRVVLAGTRTDDVMARRRAWFGGRTVWADDTLTTCEGYVGTPAVLTDEPGTVVKLTGPNSYAASLKAREE